jgi:hypothetical protein
MLKVCPPPYKRRQIGACKGHRLLRNQLLSKELLVVLCSVHWFWFLSFSFPLLFVLGSFGYRHNSGGHFLRQEGQVDDAPAEGSKSKEPQKKQERGKKGKKPRSDTHARV